MKKMNTYLNGLKTGSNKVGSYLVQSFRLITECNLKMRIAALLVVMGLILPVIFVGKWQTASAAAIAPAAIIPAPVSAPPEPFVISSSNTISTTVLSSITSLNAFAVGGYNRVVGFFVAPEVPEGLSLALAKPVSPVSALASSITSYIGSFVGLAVPPTTASSAASVTAAAPVSPAPYALGSVKFDFDGDGRSDAARWQPSTGQWKVRSSINNSFSTDTVGTSGSVIAPADYDGDGRTDFAVFKAGVWTIKRSSNGTMQTVTGFGAAGDKPVSGDYDGDTIADLAVWTASTGVWSVRQSTNNQLVTYAFGASTDIPIPGNYDGDNKMDYAVYRPSNGAWYVIGSQSGFFGVQWGASYDVPVPADYDGNGRTDYAVFRSGAWYISYNGVSTPYSATVWGNYGDQPAAADYDGDGKADLAVWRPTNGVWYISKSSNGSYDAFALGVPYDVPAESAYVKQIGGQVYGYDFAKTRLSPKNQTGGTNLYSRNFSWGSGLVSLPGRAGLDAGLGISYNSLIWTKDGSTMIFDADNSNVAPGFRIGFPTIESAYYDSVSQNFNYLMITPSGAKVEFKQKFGATNIYETVDSSYAQLKVNGSGNPNDPAVDLPLTVTTTDGTQMTYVWIAGAYRCSQIKDSNGNYITIANNDYGVLTGMTDTLGRVVNLNYNSDYNLTSITQNWQTNNGQGAATPHTYATFNYASKAINPNFDASITSVSGPQGGANITVLQSIVYADGSSTKFDYNDYGQVFKVSNIAADSVSHVLNYTRTNIESPAAGQSDCPRFTETRNWVENFNGGNETVIANSIPQAGTYTVGGESIPSAKIEVSMTGEPNNHVSKTYVGASGWNEGLPLATEDWANENGSTTISQRRWTTTFWTQDNTAASYLLNPRVTESKVGDATNLKRTTVDYITQSGITLPSEVTLYDTNQSTVLKSSSTIYKWDPAYIARRIIGLPESTVTSGLNQSNSVLELVSKVTYQYDNENFSDSTLNQSIPSVIQHDNANYGASFTGARGNLTSTTRWNVLYPDSSSEAVTSGVKYNTAGSVVKQITPGSGVGATREVKIDYTDAFNDTYNRNAFAYPTKITDPAGNFSEVQYRYDTGDNVWAKSPAPQNNQNGKITKREFDVFGRLQKQSIWKNNPTALVDYAYTRYEYPSNQTESKIYTTVTDTNGNNTGDASDEVLSESYFDGAGRIRQSRSPLKLNASGSPIAWTGTVTEYDILGQVRRQSVPTEIDSNGVPAGDDYTRNFLWTYQKYDWKGRVTRKINTDGADSPILNDSDTLISYEGCGCAGGQVTTIKGENIVESDWQNNNQTILGRRTQKIYDDILGRTRKTEVMNWDGTTPYTTTVTAFNGRDQAAQSRQYAGAEGGTGYQEAAMTYDGHGRLKTQHRPEQSANTATVYNYNGDDSIQSVVDARGASVNYSYNSRGLVEQIGSAVPSGSNIPVAPTVTFVYDNIGNRTSMQDGLGTVTYNYNQLSQLTDETRAFSDTLTNAPIAGSNSFKLEYDYTLSGNLKSLKDPYGQQFNYDYDKIGRLNSVASSTAYAGITTYASNPNYNARGMLTALHYGNGVEMAITGFNSKLQATDFEVKNGATSIIKKQYQFYNDGSLKFSKDLNNQKFDRLYKYDNLGRTVEAKAGAAARNQTDDAANIPYRQSYAYNAFGNITQSSMEHYASAQSVSNYNFTNNRSTEPTSVYDEEGNQTANESGIYQFDAAGRMVRSQQRDPNDNSQYLVPTVKRMDGAGQETKRVLGYLENSNTNTYGTSYFIRSSVTGKIVSEADSTGEKLKTFVTANGATIATQVWGYNGPTKTGFVTFLHQDASGASLRETSETGGQAVVENEPAEYDALGNNVGLDNPYVTYYEPPPPNEGAIDFGGGGYGGGANGSPFARKYYMDGLPITEQMFMWEITSGRIGGMFGLLEMSARMSAQPPRAIGRWERTWTWGSEGANGAVNTNTMTRTISTVYADSSWAINWSLFSFDDPPAQTNGGRRRLNTEQISELRKQLKSALDIKSSNGKLCNDFLKETIQRLPGKIKAGKDILAIFEKYAASKKGFFYAPRTGPGENIRRALDPNAEIRLDFKDIKTRKADGFGFPNSPDALVLELIHEMLHGAGKGSNDPKGRYDHEDMGRAMVDAGAKFGLSSETKNNVPKAGEEILRKACGGSSGWNSNNTSLDDLLK